MSNNFDETALTKTTARAKKGKESVSQASSFSISFILCLASLTLNLTVSVPRMGSAMKSCAVTYHRTLTKYCCMSYCKIMNGAKCNYNDGQNV